MSFLDPMSSLLISDAPIEHQAGVDVCTGDMRIAADDGRHGKGDGDEPDRFTWRRVALLEIPSADHHRVVVYKPQQRMLVCWDDDDRLQNVQNRWSDHIKRAALDRLFDTVMPEEKYFVHCSVRAPEPCVSDVLKISGFGLSRVLHADDYTHIPMGRAVTTHHGPLDAKFSGKPSAKHHIVIKIGRRMTDLPIYSVHYHPLIQMLPPARNWLADILASCVRLRSIITKRIFRIAEACWFSAKPKYETPNAAPVSEYTIRKHLFGFRNGLTVKESQQHSGPDSCPADDGKMAVNTKTSASWIIATAVPHHATGNRNLLSGFTTEHDDQFVHAVNRVPMKVRARGAVVTDALILPDVWFVPGLKENLVSVSQLAELDHNIGFGRGECCIRSARDAKIVGKGRLQKGGHYVLDYLKVPLAI